MSEDWAEKIAQQLLSRGLIKTGICLILGAADTGKTTLTAALAKYLAGQKASVSAPATMPAAVDLTAGVAVIDITPPVGYRMSGYFRERLSTGTSNPLHARAIAIRAGF